MPKTNKPKLIIVNADGVCCEKCDKLVPEIYYLGQNFKEDELWIECIHTGWYCPDHSPTSNCDDMECECCNAGYEQEEEEEDEDEDEGEVVEIKSEVDFDSNAMDNALYKDNLDWSFYPPQEGECSVVYITKKDDEEEQRPKPNFGGQQVAIKNWDDKGNECWNCARCGGWKDWGVPCCGKPKF